MGLYVCENCKCVENTALGQYWSRNSNIYPPEYDGKKLCSECGAPEYTDGTTTNFGKWHNRFEKIHIDEYSKKYPDSEIRK